VRRSARASERVALRGAPTPPASPTLAGRSRSVHPPGPARARRMRGRAAARHPSGDAQDACSTGELALSRAPPTGRGRVWSFFDGQPEVFPDVRRPPLSEPTARLCECLAAAKLYAVPSD
jgi:hypothetical protein